MTDPSTAPPASSPIDAPCPVCAQPAASRPAIPGSRRADCPRCGQVEAVDAAVAILDRRPYLRAEASRLAARAPRPADGWLFVTVHLLHEMFPAELGPVDG